MFRKKQKSKPESFLGRAWYFIWDDNSVWSWLVNILLAFVLIKFVVYPGLGLVLSTSHPVVAVVSDSMHHDASFDEWWSSHSDKYQDYSITKEEFRSFKLHNGFNKGDIIVLRGSEPQGLKVGDIIVFFGKEPDPIIHRVIQTWQEGDTHYFKTKGDKNPGFVAGEEEISEDRVVGRAWFRIPFVGYVKIIFTEVLRILGVG
ncbi:signal peptidase I [Candidatus Woesearchaeota archaeon]|nr:signal peptidase I [Candidatus Woesearchaeota archaeon]